MSFRYQGKKLHLTYKTHLPLQELLAFLLEKVGPLEMYSLVHENGKVPEPVIPGVPTAAPSVVTADQSSALPMPASPCGQSIDANTTSGGTSVPYAHTHVLLQSKLKLSTRDPNYFDFAGIHPNWKPVATPKHFANTWDYHLKEPISRLCSKKTPGPMTSDQLTTLIEASSLAQAIQLAGVEVKTVSDLVHLRTSRETLPYQIPGIKDRKTWNLGFVRHPMVLLTGASGTGKTRFALDHFEKPLLVSRMEDLKRLTPNHDGIVFDDFSFAGYTIEDCIHICDTEMPRTINVKHGSVTIPSMLPRIITSNKSFTELFPADPAGALARRVHIVTVSHKLWADEPAEAQVHEEAMDAAVEEWGPF